jgi:hypothetical protein
VASTLDTPVVVAGAGPTGLVLTSVPGPRRRQVRMDRPYAAAPLRSVHHLEQRRCRRCGGNHRASTRRAVTATTDINSIHRSIHHD